MGKGDHEKGKGLAIGAAIGAVFGVVTGILFAPKSGKETREDIKDAASKAAERLQAEADKLQKEISDLIDKGEVHVKDASKTVSDKAKEAVEQAKHSRDSVMTIAKSVKAGKADDKDLDKAIKKAKDARDSLKVFLKK